MTVVTGLAGDCWFECNGKGGKCDFCGPAGYCCSPTKLTINGDCPTDAVQELATEFQDEGHQCIAPKNNCKQLTKK